MVTLRGVALAALCCTLGAPALAGVPAQAAKAPVAAAPRAVPSAPLPDESFQVVGHLGGKGARAVVLQSRTGNSGWVAAKNGRTSSTGRYAFVVRTHEAALSLRVEAPRVGKRPLVRTPTTTVTPISETSTLTGSGDVTTATLSTTLTPVRVDRKVRLQADDGGWHTIQTAEQSSSGLTWTLTDLPEVPRKYRIAASRWHGAPLYIGPAISFTPDPLPVPLPRFTLGTAGAAPVTSKESYLSGTLTVDDGETFPMRIRGRGNSTWTMPKKPYRIKLDSKASLLGLPEEKDWVLLANYEDRSMLRTWLAFGFGAKATGLAWTPEDRFVDVSLNGQDLGTYVLTEQVEASPAKVALPSGGQLLEVDDRILPAQPGGPTKEPGFVTSRGVALGLKDPDDPKPQQLAATKAAVEDLESRLYGDSWTDESDGYRAVVDVPSFVDWYLVEELTKNYDSDFFSSIFLSWAPGQKFRMGPLWDFDRSSGYGPGGLTGDEYATPEQWWLRGDATQVGGHRQHASHWFARLLADPWFAEQVAVRWRELSPQLAAVAAGLHRQAAVMRPALDHDWSLWHTAEPNPDPAAVHGSTYDAELDHLTSWINARIAWLDTELGS